MNITIGIFIASNMINVNQYGFIVLEGLLYPGILLSENGNRLILE